MWLGVLAGIGGFLGLLVLEFHWLGLGRTMEQAETRPRTTVDCDDDCGAFEEPVTLEEYENTFQHYRMHGWLNGCAHGC